MAQAAKRQPRDIEEGTLEVGSSDLVRRLLAPRIVVAMPQAPRTMSAPATDHEEQAPGDAAITILKAALRSERAEVESLQAELAELRAVQHPLAEARLDRDRWAELVEKLVLHSR